MAFVFGSVKWVTEIIVRIDVVRIWRKQRIIVLSVRCKRSSNSDAFIECREDSGVVFICYVRIIVTKAQYFHEHKAGCEEEDDTYQQCPTTSTCRILNLYQLYINSLLKITLFHKFKFYKNSSLHLHTR